MMSETPADAGQPAHEVTRGYGVHVQDKKNHGFRPGMTVMYIGKAYTNARGRIGTIRWLRHDEHGHLQVRVDYATEVTHRIGPRFWEIFTGHHTKYLMEVQDGTMRLTEEGQEVLISDVNPDDDGYGYYTQGIKGIIGPNVEPKIVEIPKKLMDEKTFDKMMDSLDILSVPIRDDTLDEAKSLISGDRQAAYGDLLEDFGRIADIWSAILGVRVPTEKVALMMAGVKISRLSGNPKHRDSWVDIAGYAALGAEVANAKRKGL